ncbi:chemokine XC receptor 1-like [Danio rerio]|uniref:Chemokine XC receptor 1-like n=1 Tax=Danio rerio TaxID=7955 RepID=A0AC58ICC9_DANRE
MEFMSGSAVNLTTPEPSTNITASAFPPLELLEMCLMSCHFIFGLPINSYVLWLIVTGTGSGLALEFFILNLSVSGILYSLDSLFGVLARSLKSQFFTSLAVFLQGLGITGHPQFHCLMCVERYLAVVHPVTFLKYKPLRYRVICCAVAWITTFGSCLFCCLSKNHAYWWFILFHLILIFCIQLFCLVAVLKALKQSGPGERKREGEENRMKRRAFYLILITTLTLTVMYLPSTVVGLITVVTNQSVPAFIYISFVCFAFAGFVQPVLYLHRAGKLSCSALQTIWNTVCRWYQHCSSIFTSMCITPPTASVKN